MIMIKCPVSMECLSVWAAGESELRYLLEPCLQVEGGRGCMHGAYELCSCESEGCNCYVEEVGSWCHRTVSTKVDLACMWN